MSYKVFLFDDDNWLYCSEVTLEDGVYHGLVENGNWHLMYDTKLNGWFACHSRAAADSLVAVTKGYKKLTWACDPSQALFDYNTVIADARERYEAGEPADYELKPEPVDEFEDDEEIPF
jgi:hypothetical protein